MPLRSSIHSSSWLPHPGLQPRCYWSHNRIYALTPDFFRVFDTCEECAVTERAPERLRAPATSILASIFARSTKDAHQKFFKAQRCGSMSASIRVAKLESHGYSGKLSARAKSRGCYLLGPVWRQLPLLESARSPRRFLLSFQPLQPPAISDFTRP